MNHKDGEPVSELEEPTEIAQHRTKAIRTRLSQLKRVPFEQYTPMMALEERDLEAELKTREKHLRTAAPSRSNVLTFPGVVEAEALPAWSPAQMSLFADLD